MKPTVVIREYDSLTGEVIKLHDPTGFGELLAGDASDVRTFDFVITGVRDISDFTVTLIGSDGIEISPPDAIITGDTADKGNFGIENSISFVPKTSLSRFFVDLDLPVSVPMRNDYVSNFIYINLSPGTYEKTGGIIHYKINFKYDSSISSSSISSESSSSSG